jgi:hypothetical protein
MNSAWGPPLLLSPALIWWICAALYAVMDRGVVAAVNVVIASGFSYLAYRAFRS